MGAAASEESGFTCGTSFDSLSLGHKLHRKNKSTPWQGCNLKGMPVCTILRGHVQMRDGEPVGKPIGRMLRPIL